MYKAYISLCFVFSGETLSFIGDQTSYMSICVGEGADESLSQLSAQELKQKVNFKENKDICLIKQKFLGFFSCKVAD